MRRRWTEAEDAFMREHYPHRDTAEICRELGRSERSVYARAGLLGLCKTDAYIAAQDQEAAKRLRRVGEQGRFKPGARPWNAGLKGFDAGGRSSETRFRPGNRPQTWVPAGTARYSKDGYLEIKVADKHWVGLHRLLWERKHGPVPPGHIVVFADGDNRNFADENLVLISRADNVRRNGLWNRYPRPVAEAIVMRGALKRRIREIQEKAHEEPNG